MVRSGYVVIDEYWIPTGDMVSSTGEALNVFTDLFKLENWSHNPIAINTWITDTSAREREKVRQGG